MWLARIASSVEHTALCEQSILLLVKAALRSLKVGGHEVGHVASEVRCLASQPSPSYSFRCSMRIATATAFSLVGAALKETLGTVQKNSMQVVLETAWLELRRY